MAKACLFLTVFAFIILRIHAEAPNNGITRLQKDEKGFFVDVNLNGRSGFSSGKAEIALYTSKTVLSMSSKCINLNFYNCNGNEGYYDCWKETSKKEGIIAPYFTAQGLKARANIGLDTIHYNTRWNSYLLDTCNPGLSTYIANERDVIVGLGLIEEGSKAFNGGNWNNRFGIYINKDLTAGTLMFNRHEDGVIAAAGDPITLEIPKDGNWITASSEVSFVFPEGKTSKIARISFDPHSDVIALPSELYEGLINRLGFSYQISCGSTSKYQPECTFKGKPADLPTFHLTVQGKSIPIPPSIYLKESSFVKPETIVLNLKATDPSKTNTKNYIHNAFKDVIFLDQHFISHYYSVFKDGEIVLYEVGGKKVTPVEDKNGSSGVIIVVVILVLVAAVGGFIYMKKQKQAANTLPENFANPFGQNAQAYQNPQPYQNPQLYQNIQSHQNPQTYPNAQGWQNQPHMNPNVQV